MYCIEICKIPSMFQEKVIIVFSKTLLCDLHVYFPQIQLFDSVAN